MLDNECSVLAIFRFHAVRNKAWQLIGGDTWSLQNSPRTFVPERQNLANYVFRVKISDLLQSPALQPVVNEPRSTRFPAHESGPQ